MGPNSGTEVHRRKVKYFHTKMNMETLWQWVSLQKMNWWTYILHMAIPTSVIEGLLAPTRKWSHNDSLELTQRFTPLMMDLERLCVLGTCCNCERQLHPDTWRWGICPELCWSENAYQADTRNNRVNCWANDPLESTYCTYSYCKHGRYRNDIGWSLEHVNHRYYVSVVSSGLHSHFFALVGFFSGF